MDSQNRPHILIRTLPISKWNYGGILQAYALQEVLRDFGMVPITDISRVRRPTLGTIRDVAADRIKRSAAAALPPIGQLKQWGERAEQQKADRTESGNALKRFVDSHIDTVRLYRKSGRVDQLVLRGIDAFVAGSDQIWRRRYSDVASYLFDFLGDDQRVRISYAASFGVDDINDYGPILSKRSAALARRLTAVSVREASGVEICREQWGIDAEQHLDPTMLLDRSHYDDIASSYRHSHAIGALVSYLLDSSDGKVTLVDEISSSLGLRVSSVLPRKSGAEPDEAASSSPARLPMEGWIKSFADAEFVITDSFHGVVFSILYNKPFLAISNEARGNSRFDSILSFFGLQDRLIDANSADRPVVSGQIDWIAVNHRLATGRADGAAYLRRHLDDPDRH